jgi:hypothetical protein
VFPKTSFPNTSLQSASRVVWDQGPCLSAVIRVKVRKDYHENKFNLRHIEFHLPQARSIMFHKSKQIRLTP